MYCSSERQRTPKQKTKKTNSTDTTAWTEESLSLLPQSQQTVDGDTDTPGNTAG